MISYKKNVPASLLVREGRVIREDLLSRGCCFVDSRWICGCL